MINPWIFYFASVVDNLWAVALVGLIVSVVGGAIGASFIVDSWNDDDKDTGMKIIRHACIAAAISVLFIIFIPDKEVIYAMQIAKAANGVSLEDIKAAVDYVIEAVKGI